jgi:hypothetical protein
MRGDGAVVRVDVLLALVFLSFGCDVRPPDVRIRGKVLGFDGAPLPYPALSLYMNTFYLKDVATGAEDRPRCSSGTRIFKFRLTVTATRCPSNLLRS